MQILLLSSPDGGLLSQEVSQAVEDFLDGEDPSAVVDKFTEERYTVSSATADMSGYGEKQSAERFAEQSASRSRGKRDIRVLCDAARTMPMLASKRVIVARDLAFFGSARTAWEPLLDYLQSPSDFTALILVWEKGPTAQTLPAVPKFLTEAVKKAGGEVRRLDFSKRGTVARGSGAKSSGAKALAAADWLDEQLVKSGLKFDKRARALLVDSVHQQEGRLSAVLEVLGSTYGASQPAETLTPEDIVAFLPQQAGVPPWELTDAIDRGDRRTAMELLPRVLGNETGGAHGLMFWLYRHYEQIFRLDGSGASTEKEAAKLLGLPPNRAFTARRSIVAARKLGSKKIARCMKLLADADLDLRGRSGLDQEVILELLVARLASQTRWR